MARDWTIWGADKLQRDEEWLRDRFGSVTEWRCQEAPSFQLVELREQESENREEYVLEVCVLGEDGQPLAGRAVVVAAPTLSFYENIWTDKDGVARFGLGSTKWRYGVPGEGPLQVAVHGDASDGVTGLGRAWVYDGPDRWLNVTFRWREDAPPPPPVWKAQILARLEEIRALVEGA